MGSVLLVSETQKGIEFFTSFLSQNFCSEVVVAHNGEEAKRILIERDFEVCLINAPLKFDLGEKLSIHIAEKNICQVILVVKVEQLDEIAEKVEDYGVITVGKPINRQMLWSALKLAKVAQKRLFMMQKEKEKLQEKLEDIKLISRAKCVLISYLGMSEEDAHKYIEKQAMDMRSPRKEIALGILSTYEQ